MVTQTKTKDRFELPEDPTEKEVLSAGLTLFYFIAAIITMPAAVIVNADSIRTIYNSVLVNEFSLSVLSFRQFVGISIVASTVRYFLFTHSRKKEKLSSELWNAWLAITVFWLASKFYAWTITWSILG